MNIEVSELLAAASPELASQADSLLPRPACSHDKERSNTGIVTGTLVGRDEQGRPLVACSATAARTSIPVRSAVVLEPDHVGREVVMICQSQEPPQLVVIGVLQPVGQEFALSPPVSAAAPPRVEMEVDGQRREIVAERELVFRCGKSSVTLSRDGKITIRGEEIVSRANGANRIQGGSIQLN